MSYGKSVFIALDQGVNALLGGWPDETISSRAWRWHVSGVRHWPQRCIDALFFWDSQDGKRHCELSHESERLGRQLPPELRI
ncbi:pseudouridine synthase [Desulfovibrio sp. SGI.169]|uniref:pseudouridine synthase n=1 Tax=Desulfovibrio sp. SGI.169 TaxID=3420561 RepID=UPI003CFDA522